ncbi:uncharacterized protein LOC131237792 [Magnolia sinica]|uniref:uncharacterized protein LOC131237792 n=1 Tax=Magnolia sinica TaxID=86752 RepID=UPI002658C85B|nr:uncharacterized protein LOC131237792 [Magnolia sinica]
MAFGCLKIVNAKSPLSFSGKDSNIKLQTRNPAFVIISQAIQEPPQLKHALGKRGAIVYLTASLVTALFPIETVEARTTKAENKRKVREKLKKLREKARASESKADSSSRGEKKESKVPQNSLLTESPVEVMIPQ